MLAYVGRRLLHAIPILWGVLTVTFALMYVVPGDPARIMMGARADEATVRALRSELGLDDPLPVQYGRFLLRAARADLGRSYSTNRDVVDEILLRVPATAVLGLAAITIAVVLGVLVGVLSAVRPYSAIDQGSMVLALVGISIPVFFLGLVLAWVFGYLLGWLPISGYRTGVGGLPYLVLPAAALAAAPLALIARLTRSCMLEVLREDYVRTARAKGLGERRVVFKHALKNALNPILTAASQSLAAVLAGAFFVEFIFNWPGIGLLAIQSIHTYDFPMIQGTVLFDAAVFIVINIFVDLGYAALDPRLRVG
ncbi:MAG: ABC transporter permease [Gemmatimonadetes bacterium]|nr:ABC transporter permease [Gemmatimonadota bacterium]